MYTPKIIKPYAQPFILAILIALLLCNCRSASQHSSVRVSEQADSVSVRLSGKAHGSITSQAQTVTSGRLPGTLTRRNQRIQLPVYPRHRNWKSRGAKSGSKSRTGKMFRPKLLTLYHIRKHIQDSRTNTPSRRAKSKQSPEQTLKEV